MTVPICHGQWTSLDFFYQYMSCQWRSLPLTSRFNFTVDELHLQLHVCFNFQKNMVTKLTDSRALQYLQFDAVCLTQTS